MHPRCAVPPCPACIPHQKILPDHSTEQASVRHTTSWSTPANRVWTSGLAANPNPNTAATLPMQQAPGTRSKSMSGFHPSRLPLPSHSARALSPAPPVQWPRREALLVSEGQSEVRRHRSCRRPNPISPRYLRPPPVLSLRLPAGIPATSSPPLTSTYKTNTGNFTNKASRKPAARGRPTATHRNRPTTQPQLPNPADPSIHPWSGLLRDDP